MRKSILPSLNLISFIILLSAYSASYGQTSAWGSYDVFSRINSQYSIGYMTTIITLPDYLGGYYFKQKGIMYTKEYNLVNLGTVLINSENEVNFFLRGVFRIGAGIGNSVTSSVIPTYPGTYLKYYVATLDAFAMDIGFDYTHIFDNGSAIVPRFQIGLVNLGGTIGILKNGVFRNNTIGEISAFTFSIKPSIYYNFGRSSLGFALFYNPFNILDYRIVPSSLFISNDRGLTFKDSLIKRYAMQIMFSF